MKGALLGRCQHPTADSDGACCLIQNDRARYRADGHGPEFDVPDGSNVESMRKVHVHSHIYRAALGLGLGSTDADR